MCISMFTCLVRNRQLHWPKTETTNEKKNVTQKRFINGTNLKSQCNHSGTFMILRFSIYMHRAGDPHARYTDTWRMGMDIP